VIRRAPDAGVFLLCVVSVPLVHRTGPVLRAPYWLDESWVALSSKAPLGALPTTTASTPIGWTFLVWLVPPHGQVQRLIPLAFLAGSVVAAYAFGRVLGLPVLGGATCAAAVLLLPAQQARHDLKQYTADAAVALLLLALLAWAESAWSGRRAAVLGAAIVGGMLISHAAALSGVAVLAGALVAAVADRRLAGGLVFAGGTAAGMSLVYLLADRRGRTGAAVAYWAGWFPSPAALPGYLADRLGALRPAIGIPWPLFLSLAAVGVVVVAVRGRPATAVSLAVLPAVAVAAGVAHAYPLLDQRTSHFLLVTGAAVAAAGLAAVPVRRTLAVPLVACALAGFAVTNRGPAVPPGDGREDVRAQTAYVQPIGAPATWCW
jgi:hypothetical protein